MKTSLIAMIAGLGVVLASCTPTMTTAEPQMPRWYQDPVTISETAPPSIEEVTMYSHGSRLNGLFYLANGEGPHSTVILLHGYPGNEKNLDLAQSLRRDGFNVLFFHYRGAWGSEGDFGFQNVIEDVASALDFARSNAKTYRVDADHIILIGHSMGGFAALHGAANDGAVKCAAGLAPGDMARIPAAGKEAASSFALYSDTLQMLHGWTGEKGVKELTEKREAFELRGLADKLSDKSILLVAGEQDTVIPPVMVMEIADAYRANPQIALETVTMPGDHSFSWSRAALTDTILGWAQHCRS